MQFSDFFKFFVLIFFIYSFFLNYSDNELAIMLRIGKSKDEKDNLTTVEARFWFNNPHIMLTMMQFCMWQNGQTLAGLVFYGSYFAGMDGSCYYVNRGIPAMILSCLVCILTLLHASYVTVPTFSMVTHMASHKKKKDALIKQHKFEKKHGLHRQHTAHQAQAILPVDSLNINNEDDLENGTIDERIANLEEKLNQLRDEKEMAAIARGAVGIASSTNTKSALLAVTTEDVPSTKSTESLPTEPAEYMSKQPLKPSDPPPANGLPPPPPPPPPPGSPPAGTND
jgi:hypothetical protein